MMPAERISAIGFSPHGLLVRDVIPSAAVLA
jgi:hypothetical protein